MGAARKLTAYIIFLTFFPAIFHAGATGVSAQEKAAGPSVAGRIPRPASGTLRPVAVITRRDIELSGAQNVRDLLSSRADFNSFGLYRPYVAKGRYAILVNGRRAGSFDSESFPLSAVERVEILGASAAALYGGDAVGGAINIVLRRDFQGFEARAGAARPRLDGADSEQGGFVWGGALGRGRAVIGLDVVRREEIRDADRDYSRGRWIPGGSFADAFNVSVGGNSAFITLPDGNSVARSLGACEGSGYVSGLTNPLGVPGTGCAYDFTEIKWHLDWERLAREGLFLSAEHPLGESADIYIDARVAQSESTLLYAPSVGRFNFSPPQSLRDKLLRDPEINALPDEIDVFHRFVAHGDREWVTEVDQRDMTLGVRGELGEVGYDAHFRYYFYDANVDGNTFVSNTVISRAVADGRYDIENPFSTDPAHLAAIRESSLRLSRERVVEYSAARASFNGQAIALPGGSALWAAGAEIASLDSKSIYDHRDESGNSYPVTDVLGSGGSSWDAERRTVSAFAEVSLPLAKEWELTLAGRHDDHDDVGATFSGQVASRYKLNKNLALRASWGTGGQPPALSDLNLRGQSVGYPYVCDVSTHTGDLADCDKLQVEHRSGANPDLEPDEAESLSIGAAASAGPLSLSLDWYRINISNVPAGLAAQTILNLEAKGELPTGVRVVRDGNVIRRIEGSAGNIREDDIEGINLNARVDLKTDAADIALALYWSRVTEDEVLTAGEMDPYTYPRDRYHASLRMSRGRVTANWSIYGISAYWNRSRTARYAAWMGHDFTLSWRDAFGLRGLELIGGVLNIADRGPSTAAEDTEESDFPFAAVQGRTLFLNARYTFGS
ncbi:MAG: TonB-dependent receptor [Nitrospinae bacterium]|nr:TonB-dependent receptor [Nitrospinota bacterium]